MKKRRLVLIRHAKTEQGAGADIDRRLTDGGRRDAASIGTWLQAQSIAPDTAVVSPATRAQETWQLAAAALDPAPATSTDGRIYDNTVENLLDVVREQDAATTCLVLVAHNPSVQAFAAMLVANAGRLGDLDPRHDYPTSGVTVFDVDGEWSNLSETTARLAISGVCRG